MSDHVRAQERQAAWQALKKASGGNTCWAGTPTTSVVVFAGVSCFGLIAVGKGVFDLALGRNKFR